MPIFITNSLTRKKEEFIPLKPPKVNIYTCGVTVYDECHIGHARSLYIFEVMRRYLEYRGFKVNFVRNITDIDDKIINRAKELGKDWKELVGLYIERYDEDLKALGIGKAGAEPRATENIPDMVNYIKELIKEGYAYVTNTGVYFSVRKFSEYGKLSGQGIEQMFSGVRKEPDETKEDPLDFALWKISKPGEPSWPSDWGAGRPGWHIECSVMSQKFLKTDTLDIHAGGRDLIFPHHENEIAQSEALTRKPFAKYWIHHGLLTINGQKMAKSLGNFITIQDVLSRYPADILKIFYLQAHYSSPIDFSWEKMEEAKQAYERILILMNKAKKATGAEGHKVRSEKSEDTEEIKNKFMEAMDDDFNTPQALASIFELITFTNKNIEDFDFLQKSVQRLRELLGIFGISLETEARLEKIETKDEVVENMIKQREKARKEKNFAHSDKIRKELEEKGIILEDTKDNKTTWRRKL